jgi:hypothetical protein
MLRAQRFFRLMLLAYPRAFRREFGLDMAQVFRDCYRAEKRTGGSLGVWRLWLLTLLDLLKAAPQEHLDNLGKDGSAMNNQRKDIVAVIGCIGIIGIAFWLLSYGRKHEVSSILIFGFALDAIVATGIVGNLIVFLLAKTTKLNSLRTAFWTFLVLHAVPVTLLLIIGRTDPHFQPVATVIGYVVSFVFWFGLHWAWAQRKTSAQPAT